MAIRLTMQQFLEIEWTLVDADVQDYEVFEHDPKSSELSGWADIDSGVDCDLKEHIEHEEKYRSYRFGFFGGSIAFGQAVYSGRLPTGEAVQAERAWHVFHSPCPTSYDELYILGDPEFDHEFCFQFTPELEVSRENGELAGVIDLEKEIKEALLGRLREALSRDPIRCPGPRLVDGSKEEKAIWLPEMNGPGVLIDASRIASGYLSDSTPNQPHAVDVYRAASGKIAVVETLAGDSEHWQVDPTKYWFFLTDPEKVISRANYEDEPFREWVKAFVSNDFSAPSLSEDDDERERPLWRSLAQHSHGTELPCANYRRLPEIAYSFADQ